MESQSKVWNSISQEWFEFKVHPAEHVEEFLKDKTGKVLDLGSGAGRHLQKIPAGKIYLVDFAEGMIELAKKRAKEKNIDAEFAVADLSNLPYEDNFFDSAIAIASLHCVEGEENRKKAVEELFRVLKPKAKAEICVWNKDSERFVKAKKEKFVKWHDKGIRYYYLFNAEEIYSLFEKAGFKIIYKEEPRKNIVFVVEK